MASWRFSLSEQEVMSIEIKWSLATGNSKVTEEKDKGSTFLPVHFFSLIINDEIEQIQITSDKPPSLRIWNDSRILPNKQVVAWQSLLMFIQKEEKIKDKINNINNFTFTIVNRQNRALW